MHSLPNLKRLDISHNIIDKPLALPQGLESLNLSYNTRCKNISRLGLANLRELIMTNNELVTLSGFASLPSLEKLDVSNNNISKPIGLEMLPLLRVFKCQNNRIVNILTLRCLSCNLKLESLDLRGNPVCKTEQYNSLRNFISKGVSVLDGKNVVSRKISSSRSTVEDHPFLLSLSGDEKFKGSPECTTATTFDSEQTFTDVDNNTPVPVIPLPVMQPPNNEVASPANGYTAQYLNSTRSQGSHEMFYGNLQFSPVQNTSYRSSPVTTKHSQRQKNQSNSSRNSTIDGIDSDSVVFNGNGSPRLRTFRQSKSKIVSESSSTFKANPRYRDMYVDDTHTRHHAQGVIDKTVVTTITGSINNSRILTENNSTLQTKPSSLPWRKAPSIKPRPWKGLHWNGEWEDKDRWVATTTSAENEIYNNSDPWIGGITVAAFTRAEANVSNKSPLKHSTKNGKPPSENIYQSIQQSQKEKDHLLYTGTSPHSATQKNENYYKSLQHKLSSIELLAQTPLSRSELYNNENEYYKHHELSHVSQGSLRDEMYNFTENYRNAAEDDEVPIENFEHLEDLEMSQLTTGSDIVEETSNVQGQSADRVKAYYADGDAEADANDIVHEPSFAQSTFSHVMRKSPVRTTDPRLSNPLHHTRRGEKPIRSARSTHHDQCDISPKSCIELEVSDELEADGDGFKGAPDNVFFVHSIEEPEASVCSAQIESTAHASKSRQHHPGFSIRRNDGNALYSRRKEKLQNVDALLKNLSRQKEDAFALLQHRLEKVLVES